MFGIINSNPWEAVKVVASDPPCSAPWTAPEAPASDCISTTLTGAPKKFLSPLADLASTSSAIGDDGVIG